MHCVTLMQGRKLPFQLKAPAPFERILPEKFLWPLLSSIILFSPSTFPLSATHGLFEQYL